MILSAYLWAVNERYQLASLLNHDQLKYFYSVSYVLPSKLYIIQNVKKELTRSLIFPVLRN